ncbi:transketolase C-terminal domain-containing protein [Kitasatospora saccharophila]|uniref:transketolase-like TK C-terminal-containing protein n=1 Tax=Kitasatospora saccharophila TaxID=407973 RepID=UPI00363375D8
MVWRTVLERQTSHPGPVGLALTRQGVPTYDREVFGSAEGAAKGGYVLAEAEGGEPKVILIGTGSEVQLAVQAREALQAEGVPTRVVSLPSVEWFNEQDQAYRDSVLPPNVRARVSVEAGIAQGWRELVGDAGRIISLDHFGASADYQVLYQEFGITADAVANAARASLRTVEAVSR